MKTTGGGQPYNLDLASFTSLYGPTIKTALSDARQYTQTKGKQAAHGKFFCCLLRLTGCLLCLTGRVSHTLLVPVLYAALGSLPLAKDIHSAYDLPVVPDRVHSPPCDNPFVPKQPEPPVKPGAFVPSDSDDEEDDGDAKAKHELAVEAYEPLKVMY